MYLSDINPELNSEINNIICESRQAKTLQERIDELMRAWDLIPKPATQFVTPTSGLRPVRHLKRDERYPW